MSEERCPIGGGKTVPGGMDGGKPAPIVEGTLIARGRGPLPPSEGLKIGVIDRPDIDITAKKMEIAHKAIKKLYDFYDKLV